MHIVWLGIIFFVVYDFKNAVERYYIPQFMIA